MEDDLIAGLTRQIKEEVIENYLAERRLVELQIEELNSHADEARFRALKTGRRLSRLGFLVVHPEMRSHLTTLLKIPRPSFWTECLDQESSRGVRFIRVRALTDKAKFRKLFLEAYARFYKWMKKYEESYGLLKSECEAVNSNIKSFQKNFDLLTVLNFLRGLDSTTLERKHYLGANFSAEEMASVEGKLFLRQVSCEKFNVPEPVALPGLEVIEEALSQLALDVYRKYQARVKRMMR